MTDKEKTIILKNIFWDYNTEEMSLSKIIEGRFDEIDKYETNLILKRMLERLNWYDLLDILGTDQLKIILKTDIIAQLRSKELKARYEKIRRILFKEPVSLSGWDPEYIKKIKSTLLSYRWYAS